MSSDMFLKALGLTERLEGFAWAQGVPPIILLSGGECTEHPEFVSLLEEVMRRKYFPMIITNGMWLDNKELRESILRPEWDAMVIQVTNDPRFYPKTPNNIPIEDSRIAFIPSLTHLIPLGRFKEKNKPAELPIRKAPTSFNLRSVTRSLRDVRHALLLQRSRALSGQSGHCSPSISSDGTLVAGETNFCFPIGNVDSTAEEVTKAIMNMSCNKCGLETNLTQEQKFAIGASRIHAP